MASISTLTDILKDFYLGPLAEQLNQEIMVYEMFEKAAVDWSGRRVVIPVHVARNTGVGAALDDGQLPTAGSQDFERLEVDAKFVYGRFNITGPAIASAKSGPNAFISYVDAEMTKLGDDVKTWANQRGVFGGKVLGYLFDGDEATAVQPYSGRTVGMTVNNATALVDIVRLDTYATIVTNARVDAVTNQAMTFSAALGASTLAALSAGAPADTVWAVVATTVSTIINNVAGAWNAEPAGITTNLADPTHFTVDRTDATGAPTLQSTHIKCGTLTGDAYTALSLDRMQAVLDLILEVSDSAPECILMNPAMRQEYTSLLVGTNAGNLYVDASKGTSGDGGFTGLSYGGIPLKTSKDCFKGSFFFISAKSWKLCELEAPGFADLDGAILSRVVNQDKYEGFYRLYYNAVCIRPNANGVLTGIDF